jgi:thioredoxin reductase (NADPH)
LRFFVPPAAKSTYQSKIDGLLVVGRSSHAGSIKRVASAVGEGAMAVQFVHEYLKEL